MTAAVLPSAPRVGRLGRVSHPVATAILFGVAAPVIAPLASLVLIASIGDAELWPHLARYVLPNAALNTLTLLAGVAVIAAMAGVGTAWIVTAYEFPGRSMFVWLLPLPLAFPTYIVAYVYVDILDGFGPVQTTATRIVWIQVGSGLLVSEHSLAARRDRDHGLRALSLRLSRNAGDVSDPEREPDRDGSFARCKPLAAGARHYIAAGASRDRRRPRARAP